MTCCTRTFLYKRFLINVLSPPWNLTLLHSPRYKVAITKQKDLEHSVGSLYNQNDMWNPAVDFSKYIEDNESIENEVSLEWWVLLEKK